MSNPSYVKGKPHEQVKVNKEKIMEHFKAIMELSGISADTPDTQRTPERFWEVINLATEGYAKEVSLSRMYEDTADLPVLRISKGIPFISFCEHHWMPFIGTVDIAYIPKGKVTGMSKLPQLVEKYAHRFQNQERMTEQIAEEIWQTVDPIGVMVISKATHTCERVEGYRRDGPYICSSIKGKFEEQLDPRAEVLQLLQES